MPKPRKCDLVPEILRRLEYLEQTNPRSPEVAQLMEKYDEIESYQDAKFDYLATKEEKLRALRQEVTGEVEALVFDEQIQAQEQQIESLQKYLHIRKRILVELYTAAYRVLHLDYLPDFEDMEPMAALHYLNEGLFVLYYNGAEQEK